MSETKRRGWASGVALTMTLLLVNVAAIWGQAGWALSHIAPKVIPDQWAHAAILGVILAVGFACAIEGVGVFLALSADEADEAGLPAGGVRLASYAVGVFVSGGLNLSHWGIGAPGIAFAFLSAISPFLWGVRARIRRGRTVAPSRRFWHPIRSIALIRVMAWEGLTTEEQGIASMSESAPADTPIAATTKIEDEPAPVAVPAIERAPRTPRAALSGSVEACTRAILAGADTATAVRESGLSAPAVRKHAAAVRALRADPAAEGSFGISAAAVELIRTEVRRSVI